MSVIGDVRKAVEFTGFPCAQISYDGERDTFFTVNADTIPTDFGDDEAQAEIWLIQLHLFAPFTLNTTELRKKIKRALTNAGFTSPSMVDASEAARSSDGTEQHIVFEFEQAAGVGETDV